MGGWVEGIEIARKLRGTGKTAKPYCYQGPHESNDVTARDQKTIVPVPNGRSERGHGMANHLKQTNNIKKRQASSETCLVRRLTPAFPAVSYALLKHHKTLPTPTSSSPSLKTRRTPCAAGPAACTAGCSRGWAGDLHPPAAAPSASPSPSPSSSSCPSSFERRRSSSPSVLSWDKARKNTAPNTSSSWT